MSTLVTIRPTATTTNTITMNTNNDRNQLDGRSTTMRHYGITPPISVKAPDPSDLVATRNLEETLRSYDYFESDAELSHRFDVLAKLNNLVRQWICDVSLQKHLPPEIVDGVGGSVHTFGSYRLGVHSKGGDIDTLLIAPRHIDRTDFFSSFVEFLRRQPEVCDLRAIEEAFVPVIKLTFDGIELDMLFARLALATIPDTLDLKDDKLLLNLDPRCVRSLNGCRVADEILDLVPNHETFKSTLRAIKLWAKKCGLYSNTLGFFGGITWAILVARICQLYPNATAATLVQKFFLVYSNWEWPTPVFLKESNNPGYGFLVWDPNVNNQDRYHLMPIITPAYPQQNSTHNVTQSTQKLIVQEIKRGLEIVNGIMTSKGDWKQLFTGVPFFQRYKHFLILLLLAPDQNQYLEWSGLVEAKIRLLVGNLERNSMIDIAHVSPEKYLPDENVLESLQQSTRTSNSETNGETPNANQLSNTSASTPTNGHQNSDSSTSTKSSNISSGMWIVGLQFRSVKGQLDLTRELTNFVNLVYTSAANSNMNRENVNLDPRYMRRRDLLNILPRHIVSTSTPTRADSVDSVGTAASSPQVKRAISDVNDATDLDDDENKRRRKLEQIKEEPDDPSSNNGANGSLDPT